MAALDLPLLMPAIRLDRDARAESARALERAEAPWLAGFLLFGGEAEQVADLTRRLRERAGRDLLVAADMERGAGQQVGGLTRLPDAALIGLAGTSADAHAIGEITAHEAMQVGIDVVFAPCVDVRSELDNPIVGNRAYGFEPRRVGMLAGAFCRGLMQNGALPVAKHYPGHGATRKDSHGETPVVEADADVLGARDVEPFRMLLGCGDCPAVMTAHVAYPALDPSGVIATFSRLLIDQLRSFTDPDVIPTTVFTDALMMAGAATEGGESAAARRALEAGCDVLLYPEAPERVAADLAGAQRPAEGVLEAAAERVAGLAALRSRLGRPDRPLDRDVLAHPDQVARRAVELTTDGHLLPPAALVIVDDDDDPLRGEVLRERALSEGVPVSMVRIERGGSATLPDLPPGDEGGLAFHVVVVMSGVGAWKGASGASAECLRLVEALRRRSLEEGGAAEVQVVWCAPRALGTWGDLHVPGTGPQVEAALADALFE